MRNPVLLLALAASPVAAQGERITLRLTPAPNQVIRLGMTQELGFDVQAEMLPSGMRIEGRTAFQGIQRVRERDAQGRVTAELTYDSVSIDLSMNGSPMPQVSDAATGIRGKTFTVVYAADGKIVDVTLPGDSAGIANTVKEMLAAVAGSLPAAPLAVGDTVTVPSSFGIPLPGLAEATGASRVESKVTFKLLAVEQVGGDRIAKLEQRTEGSLTGTLTMQITGTGTLDWNVDRGFVQGGTSDLKMEMTMQVPGGTGTMKINGAIRMVLTGVAQPQ